MRGANIESSSAWFISCVTNEPYTNNSNMREGDISSDQTKLNHRPIEFQLLSPLIYYNAHLKSVKHTGLLALVTRDIAHCKMQASLIMQEISQTADVSIFAYGNVEKYIRISVWKGLS